MIELDVPPLAARSEDVAPLAKFFLDDEHVLSEDAERLLTAHAWPGNVRELQNSIRRACLLAPRAEIEAAALGLEMGAELASEPDEDAIMGALEGSNGVIAKAARTLGISRQALYRRMQKFGIEQSERRSLRK